MPENRQTARLKICYLPDCHLTDIKFASDKVTVEDLKSKDHPNALPFSGTLLLVDTPSNKPPQGAEGHQILVPKDVAKRLLDTLPGMAINYTPAFDGHAVQRKIGIITAGQIDGNKVHVKGHIWAKDFPDAAKEIKANKSDLGMSMELADIWVADKNAKVWKLRDFKFTGGTVLFKKAAAYHDTSIAASSSPFYVKALAAAAAVLGNSKKGEAKTMPATTNGKKSRHGSDRNNVTRLAAAISAGVSANMQELIEEMQASRERDSEILHLLAKSVIKDIKSRSKSVKAKGKITDASVDPSGDASDSSGDVSAAAAEEDELTAAMDELDEEALHAKRGGDASDATDDSTGEDDGSADASYKAHADPSGDSTSDPSYDPSTGVQAEFDESDPHGSSENEDASTGEVNKRAIKKFRKNSKRHLHASADNEYVEDLRAAAERIEELQAAFDNERKRRKKTERRIEAMAAQLERHAEIADRKTLTPEVIHLLEKEGYKVGEIRASGQKLSTEQVDAVLNADPRLGLDAATKIGIKHQLMQAGLMDEGKIERYQ